MSIYDLGLLVIFKESLSDSDPDYEGDDIEGMTEMKMMRMETRTNKETTKRICFLISEAFWLEQMVKHYSKRKKIRPTLNVRNFSLRYWICD